MKKIISVLLSCILVFFVKICAFLAYDELHEKGFYVYARSEELEMSGDTVIYNPSGEFEMSGEVVIYNPSSDIKYPTGNLLKSPYELFQYWEKNGYPEYVCGVWSTNGGSQELTFGILENYYVNGNKAEDLIYLNVRNDSNLTLVYQKHSKNVLLSIMDEIEEQMKKNGTELGITCAGLYDDRNVVELTIKKEKQQNEKTNLFVSYLKMKYGDALSVVFSDEEIKYTAMLNPLIYETKKIEAENRKDFFILISALCLGLLMISAFLLGRKKILKATTNEEITEDKYSIKTLKKEIKETQINVSEKIDEKIKNMINNK